MKSKIKYSNGKDAKSKMDTFIRTKDKKKYKHNYSNGKSSNSYTK